LTEALGAVLLDCPTYLLAIWSRAMSIGQVALGNTLITATFWLVIGMLACVGLLAIVSPKCFASLSTRGNRWIDTEKLLQPLDARIDVDRYVLPFSRLLGVAVLASVATLAALFTKI
jgi:hypothetical protein